jgi:acetylornithine deacetylase/succinyl-diaminopimelate desuccinylase-like protein
MTDPAHTANVIDRFVDAHFADECAFLAELVKVPSDNPPGNCAPHARCAQALIEAMGLKVEAHPIPEDAVEVNGMISATNLVVRQQFAAGGPTIALNAHGDVVPPGQGWTHDPYGAAIETDAEHGATMYGRGVAVSKSDFATYTFSLLALRELAAQGEQLRGAIELHLTYDEEVGGEIGPHWLIEHGLSKPDLAVSAGFSYAVTTAHNGCLHLEVVVHGKQGHAAMPERGVDALAATTQILTALYASRDALKARVSKTTASPPDAQRRPDRRRHQHERRSDRVTFRLDRRIIPEESPQAAEAERATSSRRRRRIPAYASRSGGVLLSLPC